MDGEGDLASSLRYANPSSKIVPNCTMRMNLLRKYEMISSSAVLFVFPCSAAEHVPGLYAFRRLGSDKITDEIARDP